MTPVFWISSIRLWSLGPGLNRSRPLRASCPLCTRPPSTSSTVELVGLPYPQQFFRGHHISGCVGNLVSHDRRRVKSIGESMRHVIEVSDVNHPTGSQAA